MKKAITMILAITLAITAVVPSNKANAEGAVPPPPDLQPYQQAPEPTPTPTPEPQEHYDLEVDGSDAYEGGKLTGTGLVTKGFKVRLRLKNACRYKGTVQWTSSRPDIATINADGIVTGKKYGKTTITALYNGERSTIDVKVVKNEYTGEARDGEEIVSMKFDSKGNLKCTLAVMEKLTKSEIKAAKKKGSIGVYQNKTNWHCSSRGGSELTIKYYNGKYGKLLLKKTITNKDRDTFCCKGKDRDCHYTKHKTLEYKIGLNKPRYIKFTVKKKYLKKLKNADLRKCCVDFL